jgi:hypothetical protein
MFREISRPVVVCAALVTMGGCGGHSDSGPLRAIINPAVPGGGAADIESAAGSV